MLSLSKSLRVASSLRRCSGKVSCRTFQWDCKTYKSRIAGTNLGFSRAPDAWAYEFDPSGPSILTNEICVPWPNARERGPGAPMFHLGFSLGDSGLVIPERLASSPGNVPEAALKEAKDLYQQVKVPYVLFYDAYSLATEGAYVGTLTMLTPPVEVAGQPGVAQVGYVTAEHCLHRRPGHFLVSNDLASVKDATALHSNITDGSWKVNKPVDILSPALHKELYAPGRTYQLFLPETTAMEGYKGISEQVLEMTNEPDVAIMTTTPRQMPTGGYFPCAEEFGNAAGQPADFMVPTCKEPALHDLITVSGMPGPVDQDQAIRLYGAEAADAAALVKELHSCLKPYTAVVSPGDILAYDGWHLAHRSSAWKGMAGGPVRVLDRPQLLLGIHTSGRTDLGFNVAVSVNHKLFVVWYVREILPIICRLSEDAWPAEYMRSALALWLQHHRGLIESEGLWEGSPSAFCHAT
ncbi:hypothetical protein WJX73_005420 [Symbiochloris irregularis]|uniref:TauD/TfdA-like domain-containing protein n=1 Tax=Symbiochloris irregularis TaxID=706552 RepID=A0AAW1NWU6_9CHLO